MRRRLHLVFALLVLVAGIALRAWDPPIIAEMRFRAFDLWQRIAPRPFEEAPVTIVSLDEESLKRVGQWPWPRTVIAKLVTNLQEAGASAIAFDVIYSEADRSSPASLMDLLPDGAARLALQEAVARGEVVDNDEVFAQAIAHGGVVLGFAFAPDAGLQPPDHKAGVSFVGESPVSYVPRFGTAVLPLPELGKAASGLGSLNVIKDNDGIIRRIPLLLAMGDDVYPSLALEALRVAQKAKNILVKVSGAVDAENSGSLTGVQAVRVGKLTIPTAPGGQILLYDAGPQTTRHLPAWQVLDGSFDKSRINGHIVFFGATATGLYDAHATPLASVVPGIEQHAQVAEQAILGQFLNRPAWADGAELLAVSILGFLVLITFFFRRLGARWAALIGFVLAGGGIWVSWWAFSTYHFLLDPLTPAMVGGAVYLTAVVTSFLQSERERHEVRRAFGQYVAPAVVERIAQRPGAINLGGETRPVTLMFCDLRDFTSLSEKLTAPELTKLVNRFLTTMTAAIYETGGTVDKYIGDCVMAFWNAPLDDPAHALNACKAALDMRRRLVELNIELAAEGGLKALQLRMGIGINSGDCNVGNMGSDQRLAYTAVGDPVNLASRLEGQTKAYKLDCLVSETSAAQSQELALLPVDRLRVKGRQQPVQIYALLGDADLARKPDFQSLKDKHAAFMTAYIAGDWPGARAALQDLSLLAQHFQLDELIKVYGQRLDRLEKEPTPADWDGVFTATEK